MSDRAPALSPDAARTPGWARQWPFLRTPMRVQVYLGVCLVAALVLPFALADHGLVRAHHSVTVTLAALLVASVVNVEAGRILEGGLSRSHRPHKALSAWSFCSALLLPMPWLVVVVAVSYLHVRWRGLRLPLWKWVGSAAFLCLCGVAAACTARAVHGDDPNWMGGEGGRGLLAVVAAAAVFLAVEAALFHGSAYLNSADDEVWLRRTLASWSFYVTEGCVLLVGALSAAVWTAGAWFVLLLVPVYVMAQQAVLHEPMRRRADVDEKTGLLRFESWRRLAVAEQQRCHAKGRSWSVGFADLDHFKRYNDTFGHLCGDRALAAVADVLRRELRSRDLVGRFGGEEFCMLFPDTPAAEAARVAERVRAAVAATALPGSGAHASISIGVVTIAAGAGDPEFVDALTAADRAVFTAKTAGRNRVHVTEVRDVATLTDSALRDEAR